MWLTDISLKRPVFAAMIIGALMALGWISLGRLGVDLFPRFEFPFVSIQTTLEGASPETVETEITDLVEAQAATISGIDTINSQSAEGFSLVLVEFGLDQNVDVKAQDVRDKVALVTERLPTGAEAPIVQKIDPDAQPILSIMVAGALSQRELTRYADDVLKERIQRVPGVGNADVVGGREREIRIWLDAVRLRAYGVTASDVADAIRREHAEIPGGRLDTKGQGAEFSVKTMAEAKTIDELGEIVVKTVEAATIKVKDVGRLEDGLEDERSYAELDGKTGVALEVRRQSGENTLEVAKAIKAELAKIAMEAPAGVEIVVARDISTFIEESAEDVFFDIQIGVVLVVIVTLLFLLSIRATLIVAVAMPASLISTFFAFYVADITINMLTLTALSLSVGLLVDDAIVVLESIHRRIEQGMAPLKAAYEGTAQVALAVAASTFAIAAVFASIAFMEGIVGRFFYQYGLAIVFSVLVSLLVSLTLTPVLCARFMRAEHQLTGIALRIERGYRSLERFYERVLMIALRRRGLTLLIGVIFVAAGVMIATRLPFAFDSATDRSEFLAEIELPYGAGIAQSKEIGRRVAEAIHEADHVRRVFFTVGGGNRDRVNVINYYVALSRKHERREKQIDVMNDVRGRILRAVPEAKHVAVLEVPWVGGTGSQFDIQYAIEGPDLAVLRERSEFLLARMAEAGLFADLRSSFEAGKPEVRIDIDRRRAADLDVSARTLAGTVRTLIGGQDVATYEEFGQRYDIRLRLEEDQRDELAKLQLIQVRSSDGRLIDLANLARIKIETGAAQIDRRNRSRSITVMANTPPGVALGPAVATFRRILAETPLPPGYSGAFLGEAERMAETGRAIGFAFMLALLALYMILASQFNSFAQPAIIMLTAPLSFMGAFFALWIAGGSLTLFTQIGLIALMGLVMKNGILLVDYANVARQEEGLDARRAMMRAGPVRLRPVLMTTIATIFGMVPIALSDSQGAEMRNAMGTLVIGGLISSTLLTLVLVPVVYTLFSDAARLRPVSRAFAFIRGRRQSAPAE